jgi:hypoxanthine phosphoribosyltransferase
MGDTVTNETVTNQTDTNGKVADDKVYISANDLLVDSFRLAQQIYDSGFRPDFIIGVWRGGAPVGIAIQEYLEYVGIHTDHIAIRTSSYYGINKQDKTVRVHGLDYIIDNVNAEHQVLLVDDVFDSGRSIRAIFDKLRARARRNMPETMRVATPWYKPAKNVTDITPDYYVHETDAWLVFPHELVGLTPEEILANKGDLASTISPGLHEP